MNPPKELTIAPSALYAGEVVLRGTDGEHYRTMPRDSAHRMARKYNLVLIPERFHRQRHQP